MEKENKAIKIQLKIDHLVSKIVNRGHVTSNDIKQANIKKKFLPNFRKIYLHKIIWKVANMENIK